MSSLDLRPAVLAALIAACSAPDAPLAPSAAPSAQRVLVAAPSAAGINTAAVGDLDGDGDLDRVDVSFQYFQPFLNDGQGVFTPGTLFLIPQVAGEAYPDTRHTGYEIGDYDGDGYGDIVAWTALTETWYEGWYPYAGDGAGVLRVAYGSPSGPQPQLLTDLPFDVAVTALRFVGDVDGDGDHDLAAEYRLGFWDAMFTTYAAEYFDPDQHTLGRYTNFYHHGTTERPVPVAGDVQGDGYADDLVGADGPSGVRWRAGGPGGSADGRTTELDTPPDWPELAGWFIAPRWTPDWQWTPPTEPYDALFPEARGSFVQGIEDVNADGFSDMVVIEQVGSPHLDWFAGAPDGYGQGPVGTLITESSDRLYADGVVAADFDGDGEREVIASVVTRGYQSLLLFFLPGPGVTLPYRTLSGPGVGLRAVGDVNNDGFDDLLVGGRTLVYGGPASCPGGPVQTWYPDSDGDGYASSAHALQVCSQPAGASAAPGTDCNDVDATVHPGAAEAPLGVDMNCDGVVVVGLDLDGDQYISGTAAIATYEGPARGRATMTGDCDDHNSEARPGAYEGTGALVDLNCSGTVSCYTDNDGDGLGTGVIITVSGTTCANPAGGVARVSSDCDDANPTSGAMVSAFLDADGDGWGANTNYIYGCLTAGRVTRYGDCNDGDPAINPGATEVVGGADENCTNRGFCYTDQDDDGYGSGPIVDVADATCGAGLATLPDDCADADPTRNPGLSEVFGGVDEDCDGVSDCGPVEVPGGVDEDCDGTAICFVDLDGDGWGSAEQILGWPTCEGVRVAGVTGDCDDATATRSPGLVEIVGGSDEDCDGAGGCYVDLDGDGWAEDPALFPSPDPTCATAGFTTQLGDCADNDPTQNPDQTEIDGDPRDEDCDGFTHCYRDRDQDGGGDTPGQDAPVGEPCAPPLLPTLTDCDGTDPTLFEGAPEIPGNGVDEDCSGRDPFDLQVQAFVQHNQRMYRVTVSGPPPGSPIRIYASDTTRPGRGPCLLAGTVCGDLPRPFIWATGFIGANGRLVVTLPAQQLTNFLQAFTFVNGRVGQTEVRTP